MPEAGVAFGVRSQNLAEKAIADGFSARDIMPMTGARITSTLINSLRHHDKQFGRETMCVGGGRGMAMVLERLS